MFDQLFSQNYKFSTWRKLWVALAEGERLLGVNITQAQVDELKSFVDNVNYEVAEKKEKEIGFQLTRFTRLKNSSGN